MISDGGALGIIISVIALVKNVFGLLIVVSRRDLPARNGTRRKSHSLLEEEGSELFTVDERFTILLQHFVTRFRLPPSPFSIEHKS